jgi:hypothetical protein
LANASSCLLQIVEAVAPIRDQLDACCIFPSMPAVMKLNKLGTFNMAQLGQSKSIIGDFIKSARKNNDNFEEGLLKLVSGAATGDAAAGSLGAGGMPAARL